MYCVLCYDTTFPRNTKISMPKYCSVLFEIVWSYYFVQGDCYWNCLKLLLNWVTVKLLFYTGWRGKIGGKISFPEKINFNVSFGHLREWSLTRLTFLFVFMLPASGGDKFYYFENCSTSFQSNVQFDVRFLRASLLFGALNVENCKMRLRVLINRIGRKDLMQWDTLYNVRVTSRTIHS